MLAALLWGLALRVRLIRAAPAEDDESKHRHPLGDAVFIADADTVSSLLESQDIVVAGLGPIAPNHKVLPCSTTGRSLEYSCISRGPCQDHLGRTPMMLCGIDPQQTRDRVDQACGRIAKMLISAGAEVGRLPGDTSEVLTQSPWPGEPFRQVRVDSHGIRGFSGLVPHD